MKCRTGHPEFEAAIARAIQALDADMHLTIKEAAERNGLRPQTLRDRYANHRKGLPPPAPSPRFVTPTYIPPPVTSPKRLKKLFIDIETLPNLGYFFDTYSERQIPLDFIEKPKAICSVAWKFSGDKEPSVLYAATPYDDKDILPQVVEVISQADYVIAHYGDGFDFPFIEGRLAANGLPPLPPFASIDTYKLAKKRFRSTLNSNTVSYTHLTLPTICSV